MRRAELDPTLSACVVGRQQLVYGASTAAVTGAPWVRSGSALARFEGRLLIVQDDALWLVRLEESGALSTEALPVGRSGQRMFGKSRQDKRGKPDFEAAAVLQAFPPRLLVFGSGSLASRQRVAVVTPAEPVRVVEATELYAALRAAKSFSGTELNIEGAFSEAGTLVLLSRGNGAETASGTPVNATIELEAAALLAYLDAPSARSLPALGTIEQYWLGEVDGVRLTFTDAATRDGGRFYVAAAEATDDAIQDGPVLGAAFGRLDAEPRYTLIRREDGAPLTEKVEGISPAARADEWLAVVDMDDPGRPAELLLLRVDGFL